MKVIVSACLAGIHCRYDCASQERESIKELVRKGEAIPVCPEQLGGLPTPRPPAEKQGDRIITKCGSDVTQQYNQGALEAFKISELSGATVAYLKSRSPMCGSGFIYDGSFSGKLTDGDGVFTRVLKNNNITVISVD